MLYILNQYNYMSIISLEKKNLGSQVWQMWVRNPVSLPPFPIHKERDNNGAYLIRLWVLNVIVHIMYFTKFVASTKYPKAV